MNPVEIIDKKRLRKALTKDELTYIFNGYLNNEIPDYQMAALLMAIELNGMKEQEIFDLVDIFVASGELLDFSSINGIKVDKHSTGGVGDKTTLIISPIVASLGIPVCKMSGRGLGITGGTIDKLESIKGFKTSLTTEEFIKQVQDINIAISSQSAKLTPLDKKIYALRDVTATVASIPLIVVSIMSKKIASGADKILIDVKIGTGALIKNQKEADIIANLMIKIGKMYNREVRVVFSDMNSPLGNNIGNALEVIEAMEVLQGKVTNRLYDVSVMLATNMVSMGKNIGMREAKELVIDAINSGKAYKKFLEFVKYQGGDIGSLEVSDYKVYITSMKKGTIVGIDAFKIGNICIKIGGGRIKKQDVVNHSVGIILYKEIGDKVEVGDLLCTIHLGDNQDYKEIHQAFIIE